MLAREFWQRVVGDRADFLPRLLDALESTRDCVIDGVAVNAYVEPHIALDFDLVMHADDLAAVERALGRSVAIEQFAHSTNISSYDSGMRVQISTDPRYEGAIDRAEWRTVLGVEMRVACVRDVLQGRSGRLKARAGVRSNATKISSTSRAWSRRTWSSAARFRWLSSPDYRAEARLATTSGSTRSQASSIQLQTPSTRGRTASPAGRDR